MRHTTFVVLALSIGFWGSPKPASAQRTFPSSVGVQVAVAQGLSVFDDRDLDFGTVAANTGLQTIALASGRAGVFRIWGAQNRRVQITLTGPANGRLRTATDSLTLVWGYAYNENADDPAAPTFNSPPPTNSPPAPFNVRLRAAAPGNRGEAYIYIYGSVTVGNVNAGSYSGTFTVAAVYN